jgi:hypothetical protein
MNGFQNLNDDGSGQVAFVYSPKLVHESNKIGKISGRVKNKIRKKLDLVYFFKNLFLIDLKRRRWSIRSLTHTACSAP